MTFKSRFIVTLLALLLVSTVKTYSKKDTDCQKTTIYLRCLDGYYNRIKTIDIKTKEPLFEGKISKDDLKDLSFYFKKFTYYSINSKIKKAIRYEFYKNLNKEGEFYFAFYHNIATLKKAVWYNPKGKIKEIHNYNRKSKKENKVYENSFLYYNDFGVLIRKEEHSYINDRLIQKSIDTNFIVENEILAESEY